MPDNPQLRIWFQPVGGDALVVRSRDFETPEAAVTALTEAFEQGRTLRFDLAGTGDDAGVTLINLANIAAVRVLAEPPDGADDGQYL